MRVGGNNHCILSTIPEGIVCAKIITGITASIYIVTIVGLELCTLCLTSEMHANCYRRSLLIVFGECYSVSLSATGRDSEAGA